MSLATDILKRSGLVPLSPIAFRLWGLAPLMHLRLCI